MSSHISHKDPGKKPCGCNTESIRPSKLDALIAKYNTLIAEAEAAKSNFIAAAMKFLSHEEATDEDIDNIFEEQ